MSFSDELNQLNMAIDAIQGGAQEYSIGSRRVRKADLKLLYDRRDILERRMIEQETGGITVAVFDGR